MKQIILKESKHINSISHKHKKKQYGIVGKEYEFIIPDVDEVNFILNVTNKDFGRK